MSIDLDTTYELSNFEYLPKKFLNIDTTTFGRTDCNPFMLLRHKILNEKIEFVDKCQAIRYMCYIPYRDSLQYLIECGKNVLCDESTPLSDRFYFFTNTERHFKLNENLIFELYGIFFNLALERNYPYYYTINSSKYILSKYDRRCETYLKCINFLYTVVENVAETVHIRYECVNILYEYGENKDRIFADKIITTMEKTIFDELLNLDVLNNIITENLPSVDTIEDIHKFIVDNYPSQTAFSIIENINKYIRSNLEYQGKTTEETILIIWNKLKSINNKNIMLESINYFIYGLNLDKLLSYLRDHTSPIEFKIDPHIKLKCEIYSRLNNDLRRLALNQQSDILKSINGVDKFAVEEFVSYFAPYDDIKCEYILSGNSLLSLEEFDKLYQDTINEYMGFE